MLPTVFIGLIYYKKIKLLFSINHILYSLILGSFFLFLAETYKPKIKNTIYINQITLLQSIIIGCGQVLSLYPGFSRSGSTIATGILLGIKRSLAIEFSFIISIPLIIGASFFDIMKNIKDITIIDIPIFFTGFITSFTISLFYAKKLFYIIKKTSLIIFGIYRLLLAILIYFINYT